MVDWIAGSSCVGFGGLGGYTGLIWEIGISIFFAFECWFVVEIRIDMYIVEVGGRKRSC